MKRARRKAQAESSRPRKIAHALALLTLILGALVGCAPDASVDDVTPRERLCAIEGWTREYFRNETFPLGAVAVTLDKDIGLAETTVYSNAHGRVLLWDAKCGSRLYTVTATNSLGRQVIVKTQQPDPGPPREDLPPKYRLYSFGESFTYPISAPTVERLSFEMIAYQTSETGSLADLAKFPAQVGKEISVVVRYELFPENALLTINGKRVHPRLLGDVKSTRIRGGAHEYRYVPLIHGEHEVRLISYYGEVGLRHLGSFRAE